MAEESLPNQTPPEIRPPSPRKVAVVGEIPFAGAALVRALTDAGLVARVLCPDSDAEAALKNMPQAGNIEIVEGDLGSEDAVSSTLKDVYGVCFVSPITMAGRMYRSKTHLDDVRCIIHAAELHALRKLVYHSGVGANAGAQSRALRDAAAAEELISNSRCEDFRIRTGPLMGRGDGFLTEIVRQARRNSPFMVVHGYGGTLVQPLFVNDFAVGLSRLFTAQGDTLPKGLYALVGPETRSLLELTDSALVLAGQFKIKLHVPLSVLRMEAAIRRNSDFSERVGLLFDGFAVEQNDTEKLVGKGVTLRVPMDIEREILAAG